MPEHWVETVRNGSIAEPPLDLGGGRSLVSTGLDARYGAMLNWVLDRQALTLIVAIGTLALGDLPKGQWRMLTPQEVTAFGGD